MAQRTDLEGCVICAAMQSSARLSPYAAVVRDTLKLACQWGSGEKGAAQATEKALLSKAAVAANIQPDFTGAISVLSRSPAFATGRSSWIALFTAVQNGDNASIASALHQLEPLLQK